jgi:metal-responsive CopG/Arc/MetJ family transcriptional regulator
MKRATVSLPDDLALLLEIERKRRDVTASAIVRQALAEYLGVNGAEPERLPFAGIGASGHRDTASRVDDILAEEWERDLLGDSRLARDR